MVVGKFQSFSILCSFLIVGGDGHWAVRAMVQDFIF